MRSAYRALPEAIAPHRRGDLAVRSEALDRAYVDQGTLLPVRAGAAVPLDIVPRVISASEWNKLAEGIVQRVRALRPDQRNDMQIGNRHVRAAVGRDYADVPPLKGSYSGGTAAALDVTVNMTGWRRRSGRQSATAPDGDGVGVGLTRMVSTGSRVPDRISAPRCVGTSSSPTRRCRAAGGFSPLIT